MIGKIAKGLIGRLFAEPEIPMGMKNLERKQPSLVNVTNFTGSKTKTDDLVIDENLLNDLGTPGNGPGFIEPDVVLTAGFKPEEIAIITPYRVQAEFLSALKKNTKMKNVICSTVHRLQGDERKVIIYDIPNSKGSGLDGIRPTPRKIRNKFPPIDQDRKFNVAITRTQYHFVFVGNINYLMDHGKGNEYEYEDSVYRRFINAIRSSGIAYCEIEATTLIDPDATEEIRRYTRRRSIPEDPPKVSEEEVNKYKAKIIDAENYEFKFTHIMYENDFYCFRKLDLWKVKKG